MQGMQETRVPYVRQVDAPRFFVSSQQRFGVTDIKVPSAGHSSRALDKACHSSSGGGVERERERAYAGMGEGERERQRKRERAYARMGERERERERESPLTPLFICFFLPPGPALCKLGLGRSAVLPEVLTPVLRPSSVLFPAAFPFLLF